jgi:hypothetical protein
MLPLLMNLKQFESMYVKDKIIGTWSIVSIISRGKDGKAIQLFGENPKGVLTYDINGIVSLQFMMNERKNFSSNIYEAATPEEIQAAFKSYQAYYGQYYEKEPGVIVHVIEGCIFPNWSGKSEICHASIEGDKLYLTTLPMQLADRLISIKAVWQRV